MQKDLTYTVLPLAHPSPLPMVSLLALPIPVGIARASFLPHFFFFMFAPHPYLQALQLLKGLN